MSRFFKRAWDEPRGDEHPDWGHTVWYFQLDDERYPERQLEIYASGDALAYDGEHVDDEYGGLGDQPLDDEEWLAFEITAEEFETAWNRVKPRNRQTTRCPDPMVFSSMTLGFRKPANH